MGLNDIQPKHVRQALTLCRDLGELEGLLLWAYARRWGRPPSCNSK
jgi:hypothetical protein